MQGLCNLDRICWGNLCMKRKTLFQYVSRTLAFLQHQICMSIFPAFSLLLKLLGCILLYTWLVLIFYQELCASFCCSREREKSSVLCWAVSDPPGLVIYYGCWIQKHACLFWLCFQDPCATESILFNVSLASSSFLLGMKLIFFTLACIGQQCPPWPTTWAYAIILRVGGCEGNSL